MYHDTGPIPCPFVCDGKRCSSWISGVYASPGCDHQLYCSAHGTHEDSDQLRWPGDGKPELILARLAEAMAHYYERYPWLAPTWLTEPYRLNYSAP
jgi:hypothetical protein